MSSGFTAQQLAGLPGLPSTAKHIQLRAQREAWPATVCAGRGRSGTTRLYPVSVLPAETQAALVTRVTEAASVTVDVTSVTEERRELVLERARLVNAVVELVGKGASVEVAIEQVRALTECAHSGRTLRRWWSACRGLERGEWPAALMPAWRGRGGQAECHADAWQYVYDDWLRESKSCLASSYRRMIAVAAFEGWVPVPSLTAVRRRIQREVPHEIIVLRRSGARALERLYPSQTRDKSHFGVLQAVNADGHLFDVMVVWPDGIVGRPMLVGFQDLRTGKILSWRVDRSENTDVIRLAFADMVTDFGVPSQAYLDNGRSWASKEITGGTANRYRGRVRAEDPEGLMTMLGVKVRFTRPYHGQSKPIERAWRDFCADIAKHPAFDRAYVGSNPTKRPENYAVQHTPGKAGHGKNAIPLETFLAVVSLGIQEHNARGGRVALAGRSFDEVFAELYAVGPIRKVTEEQRRLLYLAMDHVKVLQDSTVGAYGTRYFAPFLMSQVGRKVTVRFHPDRPEAGAFVYASDGSYLGFAALWGSKRFDDKVAARDHEHARRAATKAVKVAAAGQRKMSGRDLAAYHLRTAAAPAEPLISKVVAPCFGANIPTLPHELVEMAPTAAEKKVRRERDANVIRIGRAAMTTLEQHADDDIVAELGRAAFAKLAGERR